VAIHTYVINLERCTERLDEFRRVNKHLPEIHRFAALEGTAADRMSLVGDRIITPDLRYSDGALGCAVSHLFFWDAAISAQESITVAEDDAVFHRNFPGQSESLLRDLSPDWDLVMWGWNFDSILLFDLVPGVSQCLSTFDQDGLRRGVEAFVNTPSSPRLFRLFRCFGTICYTISPNGAKRMKDRCLPLRPIAVDFPMVNSAFPNNGIDIAMNSAYGDVNAFVCFPPLVVTKNEHAASTVRENTAV
jgi:GR25 family glycosyltransferase involved in LPS biosynthesis